MSLSPLHGRGYAGTEGLAIQLIRVTDPMARLSCTDPAIPKPVSLVLNRFHSDPVGLSAS